MENSTSPPGSDGADVLVAPGKGAGRSGHRRSCYVWRRGRPAPRPAGARGPAPAVEHRARSPPRARGRSAGPSRPAASRSSPLIASGAWRSSSSQRRAASGAPERAGQRHRLGRLAPQQRPVADASSGPPAPARAPARGSRRRHRVALAGRELQPSSRAASAGAEASRQAAASATSSGRPSCGVSALARARRGRGRRAKPGQQPRPRSRRLEPAAPPRARLAQQQPQLGAQPRPRDRRERAALDRRERPAPAWPARSGSAAAPRSGPAAAAAWVVAEERSCSTRSRRAARSSSAAGDRLQLAVGEPHGDRVDGEVAAREVLGDRRAGSTSGSAPGCA